LGMSRVLQDINVGQEGLFTTFDQEIKLERETQEQSFIDGSEDMFEHNPIMDNFSQYLFSDAVKEKIFAYFIFGNNLFPDGFVDEIANLYIEKDPEKYILLLTNAITSYNELMALSSSAIDDVPIDEPFPENTDDISMDESLLEIHDDVSTITPPPYTDPTVDNITLPPLSDNPDTIRLDTIRTNKSRKIPLFFKRSGFIFGCIICGALALGLFPFTIIGAAVREVGAQKRRASKKAQSLEGRNDKLEKQERAGKNMMVVGAVIAAPLTGFRKCLQLYQVKK